MQERKNIVLIGSGGDKLEFESGQEAADFLGRSTSYVSAHRHGDRTAISAKDGSMYKIELEDKEGPSCLTPGSATGMQSIVCLATNKLCRNVLNGKVQKCGLTGKKIVEGIDCPLGECRAMRMYYKNGECYQYHTGEVFRAEVVGEGTVMGVFLTEDGPRVRHVVQIPMNVKPMTEELYMEFAKKNIEKQMKRIEKKKAR